MVWLLLRSPVMLPIPGTCSAPHVEENIAAAGFILHDEDFKQLSEVSQPLVVFGSEKLHIKYAYSKRICSFVAKQSGDCWDPRILLDSVEWLQ